MHDNIFSMTVSESKLYIRTELAELYSKNETESFISIIFEDALNYSRNRHLAYPELGILSDNILIVKTITERLKQFEPIQYIIGHTEFFGLKFFVNTHTLIPRPETEELVDLIIREHKQKNAVNILDIGTGSGCIACALAANLPSAFVSALDKSVDALAVAEQNFNHNRVKIRIIQEDILNYNLLNFNDLKFDIVVSNPPYICESEKALMHANVLNYEPESALFVSDQNPLIFYDAISDFALKYLNDAGKLYFEINEAYSFDILKMLFSKKFKNCTLYNDINGKHRIVTAEK